MNDEVTLVYQTESKSGTPSLGVGTGKPPFDELKLGEIENELRRRYERVVRDGGGRQTLCGHAFEVEVQRGGNSRLPRLVLRMPVAQRTPGGWSEGFFQEMQHLLDVGTDPAMPRHEKASLLMVLDELRSLTEVDGVNLGVALLASYLASAAQHCQGCDPARSGIYAVAWRALVRFLPEAGQPFPVPPEQPPEPTPATPRIPSSWLHRLFGWLPPFADDSDARR